MPPYHIGDPLNHGNNGNVDDDDWVNVNSDDVVDNNDFSDNNINNNDSDIHIDESDGEQQFHHDEDGYLVVSAQTNNNQTGIAENLSENLKNENNNSNKGILLFSIGKKNHQDGIFNINSVKTGDSLIDKKGIRSKIGRRKSRRKLNDLSLGVEEEAHNQLFGQLELNFFPSHCPFAFICEEFQGFPRNPPPDEIRHLFLKCKENEYFAQNEYGYKPVNFDKKPYCEDTCRSRVPKNLYHTVMKRNSSKQVDIFENIESIILSYWMSDFKSVEEVQNSSLKLSNSLKTVPEKSSESKLFLSTSNDWIRVCIHFTCSWHGYKSLTQKDNKTKDQIVTIQNGKTQKKIFPISDYLKRCLID